MCKALVLVLLLSPFSLVQAQQQDDGMMPRWEVVELGGSLSKRVDEVDKVLAAVDPSKWQGAGAAYAGQLEQLTQDLVYLKRSADEMGRKPEKLTLVVDTFLWLDRLDSMMGSIMQGVRRYQSPALADLLESARGNYSGDAERLKQYMRQLTVAKEEAMEIANEEAQRCRSELMSKPR